MQIPYQLKTEVDKLAINISLSEWTRAFQQLSELYRTKSRSASLKRLPSELLRLAYLHVRLPATYAAVVRVLQEIEQRMPDIAIKTLLDVGAGPGTGLWAASEMFPLQQVTCYERDPGFIALGKQLSLPLHCIDKKWVLVDITHEMAFEQRDLVLSSYALSEVEASFRSSVVQKLWAATGKALVIVEPGTPQGFDVIRSVREELIGLGAFVIAPCPHQKPCPMKPLDWCHFSARVERSSLHRQIKGGALNYEDEKFSYVIVAREPGMPIGGRIIRHPQKNSGFVVLEVCEEEGIQQRTVTRKSKEEYKNARKAGWGDIV